MAALFLPRRCRQALAALQRGAEATGAASGVMALSQPGLAELALVAEKELVPEARERKP